VRRMACEACLMGEGRSCLPEAGLFAWAGPLLLPNEYIEEAE
jgi:hypothetical protein